MALDRSKPVQTRNGVPVRIITWTEGTAEYPVVGVVEGSSTVQCWTSEGTYLGTGGEDYMDLVNVPPKQTVTWHRFWNSGLTSVGFDSREAALTPSKEKVKMNLAGLLKITWEDDEAVSVELEAI